MKIITVKFEGNNIKDLRNYFKLNKNIDICKQSNAFKSGYINQRNQLIIKTTKNHKIQTEWPPKAFQSRIKIVENVIRLHAAIYIKLTENLKWMIMIYKPKYTINTILQKQQE